MPKDINNFLLYGAYGYTGTLIAELAVIKGLKPVLAGRDEIKLKELADRLQLDYVAFDLNDRQKLDEEINKVGAVLHVAGPFSATAEIMVDACIRNKVHYLDVTGEIEVFEWIASQDQKARNAEIVLLPGVGFDVVPTDCLAAYLKTKMPDAVCLELAIKAVGELSRGTTLTMVENIHKGGMIRQDGNLKNIHTGSKTRTINFQGNENNCVSIPWGDVATAFYSTKIPDITVYMAADPKTMRMIGFSRYIGWLTGISFIQNILKNQVKKKITGPSKANREKNRSQIWGEVKNQKGETFAAALETPEGYKLTAETALESVVRVLEGKVTPGFKTPSLAFGENYILEFENVKREKLTQ